MSSRSLNRITIIGNLTRDPELKYTPQGTAVCTFGVATNRNWTTATGELKEDVQFHRVVAWQKLAELCAKLLAKGRKVYLEGRITYRTYVGKDGIQRSITEIVLDDFVALDNQRRAETQPQPMSVSSSQALSSGEKNNKPEENNKTSENDKTVEVKNENEEKVSPDEIPF